MLKKIDWDSQIGRRLRLRDLHVFSNIKGPSRHAVGWSGLRLDRAETTRRASRPASSCRARPWWRAANLAIRKPAISGKINKPKARWLRPVLLADVEYRALTGEGKVRHPSYKGLRGDLM